MLKTCGGSLSPAGKRPASLRDPPGPAPPPAAPLVRWGFWLGGAEQGGCRGESGPVKSGSEAGAKRGWARERRQDPMWDLGGRWAHRGGSRRGVGGVSVPGSTWNVVCGLGANERRGAPRWFRTLRLPAYSEQLPSGDRSIGSSESGWVEDRKIRLASPNGFAFTKARNKQIKRLNFQTSVVERLDAAEWSLSSFGSNGCGSSFVGDMIKHVCWCESAPPVQVREQQCAILLPFTISWLEVATASSYSFFTIRPW